MVDFFQGFYPKKTSRLFLEGSFILRTAYQLSFYDFVNVENVCFIL